MLHKILTIVVFLSIPVALFLLYMRFGDVPFFKVPQTMHLVTFNQKTPLRVTVVSEGDDLVRGLSGKSTLLPTEGMLFVFPTEGFHGIWMKDMQFPIDILWIGSDGRIIDIAKNVTPDSYPSKFEPTQPARYVIEVNAYFADSFNISVGDHVEIPEGALPEYLKNQ